MRALLNKYFPLIFNFLKKIKRSFYRLNLLFEKSSNKIITEKLFAQKLVSLGINHKDHLLVHSSMRKIGYLQHGADTVINGFKSILSSGTLLMPAFPANENSYNYLQKNSTFDELKTPSNMGKITEVFRTKYATHRSLHPTDSVCAYGVKAEYFTNSHLGEKTPYNKNSPFYKLVLQNGKIAMIGVDLTSLTNTHTMEDELAESFNLPVYHEQIFDVKIIDKHQKVHLTNTLVHNPEITKKRVPMLLESHLLKSKTIEKFLFFNTFIYIIDAKKLHEQMLSLYKQNITMYTK